MSEVRGRQRGGPGYQPVSAGQPEPDSSTGSAEPFAGSARPLRSRPSADRPGTAASADAPASRTGPLDPVGDPTGSSRLRLARLARGLSQQELAAVTGVSRQAVAAVEAGRFDPSLRVALALSRALGLAVEDLFGPGPAPVALDAVPIGRPSPEGRVALARVGEQLVALPLAGDRAMQAGFVAGGGVLSGRVGAAGPDGSASAHGCWAVRPTAPLRPTLVVAGCDPALPLLAGPLGALDPPVSLAWWPCSSRDALELVTAGLVHAGGFHFALDEEVGAGPVAPAVRGLAASGGLVVGLASWAEGFGVRDGLEAPSGPAEVAERGLRLVNREAGSEARALLDRAFRRDGVDPAAVPGGDSAAGGHLLVAASLAARLGDIGITTEPAAHAYGLGFVPLAEERSLLAISGTLLETAEVRALLRVLAAPGIRAQLGAIPGYAGLEACGSVVGGLPASA